MQVIFSAVEIYVVTSKTNLIATSLDHCNGLKRVKSSLYCGKRIKSA